MKQNTLMKYDPATGEEKPYPSQAGQWRDWHGKTTAWLYNPWEGNRRSAEAVGTDTAGYLILPTGEVAEKVKHPPYWHDSYVDPLLGGLHVGQMGACKYILDPESKESITEGYHEFYMHEGSLMGISGASRSLVYYKGGK